LELTQYVRALRAHWRILAACVVAGVAGAALIAALQTPQYEAHATLFVSSSAAPAESAQAYDGGLLAQQRARSYAALASSPRVAAAVAADLGSTRSAADIQARLRAQVPVDTVLVEVIATSSSPEEARMLAEAVTVQLPRFVRELETASGATPAPVSLRVAGRPALPQEAVSPRVPVYLALGLLLGLALGVAAVMLRDTLDDRVRTDDDAATAAGVPVLGRLAGASPEAYRRVWSSLPVTGDMRLLLTSVAAGAEASRVAIGLGTACVEAGRSVIVVDADLVRPSLEAVLDLPASAGLAGALADDLPLEDTLLPWGPDPRMTLLPAGGGIPPADDVLATPRFAELLDALTERADVVLVLAAPIDEVADAVVLGPLMSAVVLVTPLRDTRAPRLHAATRELTAAGARVAGLVTVARARRDATTTTAAFVEAPPAAVRAGGGR
jgi:capsular polysaccharide biosynthesis protein